MIKKRAKPERVALMLQFIDWADFHLCEAARTNVLTGTADRRLRDLIEAIRRFRRDTADVPGGEG